MCHWRNLLSLEKEGTASWIVFGVPSHIWNTPESFSPEAAIQKGQDSAEGFRNEISILEKLSHEHIVKLVGSYTDPRFVGIIMLPIADCNLERYLQDAVELSLLQTFFGCLATALSFLHRNSVRHKDIKPQNILVHQGTVLLTDFGLSRDWSGLDHSTTSGPTAYTPRYSAPEVTNYGPRNFSSDVWSLGCVFLEMWTSISGRSAGSLHEHLSNRGTKSCCYYLNMTAVEIWCSSLAVLVTHTGGPAYWIQNMLKEEQELRWNVQTLCDCIQEESKNSPILFIGLGCNDEVGSPESVPASLDEITGPNTDRVQFNELPRSVEMRHSSMNSLQINRLALRAQTYSKEPSIYSPDSTNIKTTDFAPSAPALISLTVMSKRVRPSKEGGHYTDQRPTKRAQKRNAPTNSMSLPVSFHSAQGNRLTGEQILELTDSQIAQNLEVSRKTRWLGLCEKPLFAYGDHMPPTVVFAETCVRSKVSQYARWTTLKSLVEHMTPATLFGFKRYPSSPYEGLESIPTIVSAGSMTDLVHGMLIVGMHSSHWAGLRKYQWEHEEDAYVPVEVELRNGEKIEVEAQLRVCKDDFRTNLCPYDGEWQSIHLVQGEWHNILPESVQLEDERLQGGFVQATTT